MSFTSSPPGYYNAGGKDWYLAKSLQALAHELDPTFPQAFCSGTIGDTDHEHEGYDSDHNPFITGIGGDGVCRAIDISGPLEVQHAIRDHIYALMVAKDPRVYPYGYLHIDGMITNWPAGTGWHKQAGDEGHLHVSVTQKNGNNPSPSGYVAAIDSTAPWGFLPKPAPKPPTPKDDDMPRQIWFDTDGNGSGDSCYLVYDTGVMVALSGGSTPGILQATYPQVNNSATPVNKATFDAMAAASNDLRAYSKPSVPPQEQ